MTPHVRSNLRRAGARKHALTAHIVLLLTAIQAAAAAPAMPSRPLAPSSIPVTSCADDGSPGTLRSAIASAASGDTIDLGALTCSRITLANGQIPIGVDTLIVRGPGRDALTIDGQSLSRLFFHTGYGSLSLYDLSITNGKYSAYGGVVGGGCIGSWGSVGLYDVDASSCSVVHQGCGVAGCLGAVGGVIDALGDVTLSHSNLLHNSAISVGQGGAAGAAVYAVGDLISKYSTLDDNSASPDSGYSSFGGALLVGGGATISDSTISNNAATLGGGLVIWGDHGLTSLITNSTISGNSAVLYGGGMYTASATTLQNTTIAFNQLTQASGQGAGIFVENPALQMDSTIVADNLVLGLPFDIAGIASIGGSHDLVIASTLGLPPDTISSDPQLAPLAANGGSTLTHALLASSPAIDAGINAAGTANDQRGPGFARQVGIAPDIGAFENANPIVDRIFADGFD